MARILIDKVWYEALAPNSLYEASYQKIILDRSKSLFPGYQCIEFNRLKSSPEGDARPDLALIADNYTNWAVVEVEQLDHPILRHVRPQLLKLSSARYGVGDAEWIFDRNSDRFDLSRLRDLTASCYPIVLLIVNGHDPSWSEQLRDLRVSIMTIRLFRSRLNELGFMVSGDSLPPASEVITTLTPGKDWIKQWFQVRNPAAISTYEDGHIEVIGPRHSTLMRMQRLGGLLYLIPIGDWPWNELSCDFELREMEPGKFSATPI